MTESKSEQGSEPDRPAWAVGLDLSPELPRRLDDRLALDVKRWSESRSTLRRLADAEMRVAELEQDRDVLREVAKACAETHPITRGEPRVIDRDGDKFDRVAPGIYHMRGGGGTNWTRDEIGDAQEFWK